MKNSLIVESSANSCYFRTSVDDGSRKALVQITERCNLHCAHCFVSSMRNGRDMAIEDFVDVVIPQLRAASVERVTLTGGEPFEHPEFLEFCRHLIAEGIPVGVCTNATLTDDWQIDELKALGGVHINVSFDGFRPESHGKFRGNQASFAATLETTRKIAAAGLLQGILSTPNSLTTPDEFAALCEFALEVGAKYVLMNPVSAFGRGIKSKGRLEAPSVMMRKIKQATARFNSSELQVVDIRFPNDTLPLGGCDAGKLIYVFTDGTTAVCPYLVFAARNPVSRHDPAEFIVGNVLSDDVAKALDDYRFHERYSVGNNSACRSCSLNTTCGKGCPAAVIADGGFIGSVDSLCPVPSVTREPLPLRAV